MDDIIQSVLTHAAEVQPSECCGLVIMRNGVKEYVRCPNHSPEPGRFVIAPEDYAAAEDMGEIVMVAHSHVYIPPIPSDADKVGIEQSGLPWLIVNYPVGTHTITEPSGFKAPLLGREFCKGTVDCYALVKDWFEQERQINLPEYERPQGWPENGENSLYEGFLESGFVEIKMDDLQPGDCILMKAGSSVPNHCAVYLGDNVILHHAIGRLSGRDVYGGYWMKTSVAFFRYVGVAA